MDPYGGFLRGTPSHHLVFTRILPGKTSSYWDTPISGNLHITAMGPWHGLHRSNGPASTGQESGISQDFTMENMWISLGF